MEDVAYSLPFIFWAAVRKASKAMEKKKHTVGGREKAPHSGLHHPGGSEPETGREL